MIPLLALGIRVKPDGDDAQRSLCSYCARPRSVSVPDGFRYGALYRAVSLNVLVLGFLLVSTNFLLRLLVIPQRFLGVTILVLSFSRRLFAPQLNDRLCSCCWFWMVPAVLKKVDLPIVPIILGMVLGGIMETKPEHR